MLELFNYSVSSEGKKIVKNVNLKIKSFVALLGPNGSGKSTLLKSIAGIGNYKVEGKAIFNKKVLNGLSTYERNKLGIYYSFQFVPNIKVKVVDLLNKLSLGYDKVVKELEMEEEINKEIERLSGGERKKVEILFAYLLNPKFVMLDEIDSGLDIESLKLIGKFLNKHFLNKEGIIVTHHGEILKYFKVKKGVVMINGEVICKKDIKEILKTIRKYGYKKCFTCK